MIGDGAPLTPGGDEARQWAQQELSKAKYNHDPSWFQRALQWLQDTISHLLDASGQGGGTPLILLVAAVLIALLVWRVLAARRREPLRSKEGADAILEGTGLTAAQLRAQATSAAARGDLDAAALDWFRTLARQGQERSLLPEGDYQTSHEVTRLLSDPFPDARGDLEWAATTFDRVRYGHGSATADEVERLRDIEATIHSMRPVVPV